MVQWESPVVCPTKSIKFDCNCIQFKIGFGLVLLRGFSSPVLVVIWNLWFFNMLNPGFQADLLSDHSSHTHFNYFIVMQYVKPYIVWLVVVAGDAASTNSGSGVDSAQSGCGGPRDLKATQGVIVSHANSGTSNYTQSECVWTIDIRPGTQTTLTFDYFDLEASDSCKYDHLKVCLI